MPEPSSKQSRAPLFQGPILFVNHDAQNMQALPNRHQIFTHIQQKYRKWERREKARSLRAGVRLPTTKGPRLAPASTPRGRTRAIYIRRSPLSPLPSGSASVKREVTDEQIGDQLVELERRSQRISPGAVLRKGNSDPFDSYGFEIDPLATDLIAFYRDYFIPAVYLTNTRMKGVTSTSATKIFKDMVANFSDEGGTYAFLALNAVVAARSSPAMERSAAMYEAKSTKMLIKKIANNEDLTTPVSMWHINNLWMSETIDQNQIAARAHGIALRSLFEQQTKEKRLDIHYLISVIYTDCQYSATFLTRPVFDVVNWLPQVLAPFLNIASSAVTACLPPVPESTKRLDPSIDDPHLQTIMIQRRQSTWLWVSSSSVQLDASRAQLVLLWLMYRAVVLQGQAISHYLEKEALMKVAKLTTEERQSLYAQQYISLAMLNLTRMWTYDTAVLGTPIYDTGPHILATLRRVLEQSKADQDSRWSPKYSNARLWALYVGAFGEQFGAANRRIKDDPFGLWFNQNFAEQVEAMGIASWEEAEAIFKGFLYSDHLPPHGSKWFPGILELRSSPGRPRRISPGTS